MSSKSSINDSLDKFRQYSRRALNPSLVDFIEQVQSYDYIPEITRVAEDMGLHASTIWKFMNILKEKGFRFTADVDILRLGLEAVTIVLDEYIGYDEIFKSTLRFYAPLLPWGTFLIYLIPRGMSETLINSLAGLLPREPREIIKLTYSIPAKPNLRKYYDPKINVIRLDWEELLNAIKSSPKEAIPSGALRRGKFDEIDLFIIKELEKNPFISLKKITEDLNKEFRPVTSINYIRVLRHFKNHIEARGVIRGVKLISAPLKEQASIYVAAILRGNPAELHRVGKALVAHPYFDYAYFNPIEGIGLILGSLPADEVFNFSIFLDKLREGRIVREWSYYMLDYTRKRILTIPYIILSEPINELVEYFKRYGKDRVVGDVLAT